MTGFLDRLHQRARAAGKRIVLPEVVDERTRQARAALEDQGLAQVVWVEDPARDPRVDAVAAHLLLRRAGRGMTEPEAQRLARDPIFFAAGLVALGHADGSVGGAMYPTAHVIRAGLYCLGTASGVPVVSSTFLLVRGDEVLSYADCGVVPDPDPQQLAAIAATTAHNHRLLAEAEPRVAFLSFSTKGSAEHARVEKVRAAVRAFAEQWPEIAADGELQFDAAYVPAIAARKGVSGRLGGRANVFVFPDLDAGNIAYKVTQHLGGFQAFGPIVQGLAKPCLDLSRGCSADDIVHVAAIAALMA
jgi:phosphate acetyltransferase